MIYDVFSVVVNMYVVQNRSDLMAMRATCLGARDALNTHPYVDYITTKVWRARVLDRALQKRALRWKSYKELEACPIGRNAIRGFMEGRVHIDGSNNFLGPFIGLCMLHECMYLHEQSNGNVRLCAEPDLIKQMRGSLKMFGYAEDRITRTLILHPKWESLWMDQMKALLEEEAKHKKSYTNAKERKMLRPPKAR